MKKTLLILLVILVLGGISLAIFIAGFNLDGYRPGIIRRLEESLEKPVRLEKITLGWHEGLALNLKGLVLYSDNVRKQEVLRLESVGILMNPWALLNKKVEISSLFLIEPEVRLILSPEGKIVGFETKSKRKWDWVSLLAAVSLNIDKIKIERGKVSFRDESRRPPPEIQWADIQLTLKDVAWNRPAHVQAEASFLSPRPNLELEGQIRLTQEGLLAENVGLKGDLNSVDWDQARRALSFLKGEKFPKSAEGKIFLSLPALPLTGQGLENLNMQFQLKEGKVVFPEIGVPLERINSTARMTGGRLEVENIEASFAGGRIQVSADYRRNLPNPLASLELKAEGISLDKIFPAVSTKPRLEGRLAAFFQGTIQGTRKAFAPDTLAGKGTVRLDDAVIRNFNFLKDVFSRISIIPGLVDKLGERLPPNYQERLLSTDTYLNPIEPAFTVNQGVAAFDNLSVVADSFEITGMGQVGAADQSVLMQAILHVEPDLSAALIRSVNELQYFAADGRLQIPLTLRGTLGDISMTPELQSIASRLAVSKATEAVNDWLFKKKKNEQGVADQQQEFTPRNLIGALLQGALQSGSESSQER